MNAPIPISWACGGCGGEMQRISMDVIVCAGLFCAQSKIPIAIEREKSALHEVLERRRKASGLGCRRGPE